MTKINIGDAPKYLGKDIELAGWVDVRRDHGKLIFFDLRDRSGKVQLVVAPSNKETHAKASDLRPEWVIKITGTVAGRPEGMVNQKEGEAGKVEVKVAKIEVLSEAKTPPFEINADGHDIDEEVRLKYRYLDLRRPRMQKNILLRHKVTSLVRDFLNFKDFIEIETPMLTKASPEGARDFIVPSRLQPGKFYALPQAPQQYKQLLMIAGFERYYQIARALRDEDLRGDRQFEHTQIDLEMSFVKERDVLDLAEEMMIHVAESVGKKVLNKPFPVFTHEEAMKKFGSDKFDMRTEKDPDTLAFAWVVDFPLFEWDEAEKRHTFAHNPFSAPKQEHVEKLMKTEDLANLRAQQYDLVCDGYELASGGVRISDPAVQRKVFEIMGLSPEETQKRFGHMLEAYEYGAPPHAGMAPGLDRLVMILAGEPNISEVIPFPKTGAGRDPMMDAPSEVEKKQLKELHIKIEEK